MKPFKSRQIAEKQAVSLSLKTDEPYYVVYEDGYYHTATQKDLDTWFYMAQNRDIVFCSEDFN